MPRETYVLHELYCDDLSCDCRVAQLVVLRGELGNSAPSCSRGGTEGCTPRALRWLPVLSPHWISFPIPCWKRPRSLMGKNPPKTLWADSSFYHNRSLPARYQGDTAR
jgi:hypothetical protein